MKSAHFYPVLAVLPLSFFLVAQSCSQSSLQSTMGLEKQNEPVAPQIAQFGQPVDSWSGGDCNLGALSVVATDSVTGRSISGVKIKFSGVSYDGQELDKIMLTTPSGFPQSVAHNSQPRSYELEPVLPANFASVTPQSAIVYYDCVDDSPRKVNFRLIRS